MLNTTRDLVLVATHIKANYALADADAFAVPTTQRENTIILTGNPEFQTVEQLATVKWLTKR